MKATNVKTILSNGVICGNFDVKVKLNENVGRNMLKQVILQEHGTYL